MSPTDNVPGEQTDEAAVGRAAKIRATGRRELPPGPYVSTLRDGAGRVIRREEIQVTGDSQRIELGRSPDAPVRRDRHGADRRALVAGRPTSVSRLRGLDAVPGRVAALRRPVDGMERRSVSSARYPVDAPLTVAPRSEAGHVIVPPKKSGAARPFQATRILRLGDDTSLSYLVSPGSPFRC